MSQLDSVYGEEYVSWVVGVFCVYVGDQFICFVFDLVDFDICLFFKIGIQVFIGVVVV